MSCANAIDPQLSCDTSKTPDTHTNWTWCIQGGDVYNMQFINQAVRNSGSARAVCGFDIKATYAGSGTPANPVPSDLAGFATNFGGKWKIYFDSDKSFVFCAYTIGRNGNSFTMRSEDGVTLSTLSAV